MTSGAVLLVLPKLDSHMRSFERMSVRRSQGFVYVWVLLSVALLGVGLTVAVEVDSMVTRRDQEMALLDIGRQFRNALRTYQEASEPTEGNLRYPKTLAELLDDKRSGTTKRHLRKLFVDPITGQKEWGFILIEGRIVGVHSLSRARPIKRDGFDPEDQMFRGVESYSDWVFADPSAGLLMTGGTCSADRCTGQSSVEASVVSHVR